MEEKNEIEKDVYNANQEERDKRKSFIIGPKEFQRLGHDLQGNPIFDPDEPIEFNLFK